jgi:hypothetical protein
LRVESFEQDNHVYLDLKYYAIISGCGKELAFTREKAEVFLKVERRELTLGED